MRARKGEKIMSATRLRTVKFVLASVVLVVAALLAVPEPAMGTATSATRTGATSTVDLTCNLAFQFEFDGTGLRAAKVAAAMTFCTSPNGSSPNLSAATVTGHGRADACPQTVVTGTGTDTWLTADFTKATSTFRFTLDLVHGTATATVISGALKGDTITAAPAPAMTTPATCPNGTSGLKRLAVPQTTVTFGH
jgi:hypothetical protein